MQSHYNSELKKLMHGFPNERSFLSSCLSSLPSLPYAYGLPKVHKLNTPLRPIISNVNSPSYGLSKKLAKMLSPLLGSFSNSHLRHNSDLISRLINVIPGDSKFISFDVSSLFTNVPLEQTLKFLERKLCNVEFDIPLNHLCLMKLLKLCTKNLYFEFNDEYYEQIYGIPMGNPLSPVLANFFLEHVESEFLPLYVGVKPLLWLRYVDDILCLIPHDFNIDSYLYFLNNIFDLLKLCHSGIWSTLVGHRV